MDTISVSQALQIAGRAGRYGTQYEKVRFNSFMLFMIKLHFYFLCLIISPFYHFFFNTSMYVKIVYVNIFNIKFILILY